MPRCSVTLITKFDHPRKGVALLEYPLPYVDAKDLFESLRANSDKYHRKSFDYWLNENHKHERFHPFKKSYEGRKYTNCFVFKNITEKERFYGFLCHPKADPRFELCVLVLYAQKKENAQDVAELERVERVCKLPDVLTAIRDPRLFIKEELVGRNYD
jgi:hypothetical protein